MEHGTLEWVGRTGKAFLGGVFAAETQVIKRSQPWEGPREEHSTSRVEFVGLPWPRPGAERR